MPRASLYISYFTCRFSLIFMRRIILMSMALLPAAILNSLLFRAETAQGAIGNTFTARVTLNLCPEYRLGGTTVEVKYAIGSGEYIQPTVVGQSIDISTNSGTFDISLPTIFTKTPLKVAAFCRNAFGLGAASNVKTITNCDALTLLDSDSDGITNANEDTNCDNFFSPGDASNPDSADSDGDGVRDLVESLSGTSPVNAGSSPYLFVTAGSPFDPDGDGESNPVIWRPSNGTWFIRDHGQPGTNLAIPWGLPGDIPFVYEPKNSTSEVGVVRLVGNEMLWLFHGPGFLRSTGSRTTQLSFGIFGDVLVPGPWEEAGVTNPAIARLFNNVWTFYIYKADGTVRTATIGQNGDLPKVQDYDGDGRFDIAVFRPAQEKTLVTYSSNSSSHTFTFGSGTADHTVRGDTTGDGADDISFWEPISGLFFSLTSDNNFNDTLGRNKNPNYYKELALGTYGQDLPLSWNHHDGKILYTVVNHSSGIRRFRAGNSAAQPIQSIQWGLPGDAQG